MLIYNIYTHIYTIIEYLRNLFILLIIYKLSKILLLQKKLEYLFYM